MAASRNLAAGPRTMLAVSRSVRRGSLRRTALLLLIGSLTLAATGCLTGDVNVKVNKGGSGSLDIEVLPYDELQKLLSDTNAIPMLEEATEDYDGATFESTTVDGRIAYKAHIPFDDYRDLADTLTDGVDIAGRTLHPFSTFDLKEEDGNWRLDATVAPDLLSDALQEDPSIQQLIDASGLVALNSDLRLTIALPGRVVRSNGELMAPGSVRWSLKKDATPTFMMVTEPKPLLSYTQRIFAGAGVAILVGVALVAWGSGSAWRETSGERKSRKRAKNLTFGGAGTVGDKGWDNSGPPAPVAEGTIPSGGPMPPRQVPTLGQFMAEAASTQIVTPPISNLPPVAAPVAPAIDTSIPDPFAPHIPGAAMAGGAHEGAAALPTEAVPVAPPVAPAVDPNQPDPFAPHTPGAPVASNPIMPVPTEPAPSEHPGFVFDGKPGWFSLEPEGVSDGDLGDGVPAPAFSPEDNLLTDGPSEPQVDAVPASGDLATNEITVEENPESAREAGSIPAAWYPDPDDPNRYRWWDGGDWTDYVSGEGS